jgi:hypothetical protein
MVFTPAIDDQRIHRLVLPALSMASALPGTRRGGEVNTTQAVPVSCPVAMRGTWVQLVGIFAVGLARMGPPCFFFIGPGALGLTEIGLPL